MAVFKILRAQPADPAPAPEAYRPTGEIFDDQRQGQVIEAYLAEIAARDGWLYRAEPA